MIKYVWSMVGCLVVSTQIYAADIGGKYMTYTPSCKEYIITKTPGDYRGWIEGYLSGLNETMLGIADIKEKVDITTNMLLVQSYVECSRNPERAFSMVVSGLVDRAIEKAVELQRY